MKRVPKSTAPHEMSSYDNQNRPHISTGPFENVNYNDKEQLDDSTLQVLWTDIMEQDSIDDLKVKDECNDLADVFSNTFGYTVEKAILDPQEGIQSEVNYRVSKFVHENRRPNTLLIVYYAGHGRPGENFGNLVAFPKVSPLDDKIESKKKSLNEFVWNKIESLLADATAEIFEILDCCYSGSIGSRGPPRSFELLAASEAAETKCAGPNSFTRALINSLKHLAKSQHRFTTVDLVKQIQKSPGFPQTQRPKLSAREATSRFGRIMLHKLDAQNSPESPDGSSPTASSLNGHTISLHFEFSTRPDRSQIEQLGGELNDNVATSNTIGVKRIKWGGIRTNRMLVRKNWRKVIGKARKEKKLKRMVSMGETSPSISVQVASPPASGSSTEPGRFPESENEELISPPTQMQSGSLSESPGIERPSKVCGLS